MVTIPKKLLEDILHELAFEHGLVATDKVEIKNVIKDNLMFDLDHAMLIDKVTEILNSLDMKRKEEK